MWLARSPQSGSWIDDNHEAGSLRCLRQRPERAPGDGLVDARRRLAEAERLTKVSGIARTEVSARQTEVRIDAATPRLREAEQRGVAVWCSATD